MELPPIVVMAGPVPIVFIPVLDLKVGLDGKLSAGLDLGSSLDTSLSGSVFYTNGNWSKNVNFDKKFSPTNVDIFGEMELKAYASPEPTLKLYGVAGPWVKFKAFLKGSANLTLPSTILKCILSVGFEIPIGIKIELFSKKLANYEEPFLSWETQIYEWTWDPLNLPPNIPEDPTPADGATELALNPQLKWQGGDPNPGDSITYDVYFKIDDSNFGIFPIAYNETLPNYDPGQLLAKSIYFWKVIARDSHGATTASPVWSFTTGDGISRLPTVDVKINGRDGPVNLTSHDTFTISWNSTHANSCTGSGEMTGQSGLNGTFTDGPLIAGNYSYTMLCSNGSVNVSDYVVVNIANSSTNKSVLIVAGGAQSCALTPTHGIKCWGRNAFGQLGDGTTQNHSTPVYVSGLISGIISIAAGSNHSCALTTTGGVKCWGENSYGQLGNNATFDIWTPEDVYGLTSGVVAIGARGDNTCALTIGGGVKC